jgi:hypothetical protein
VFRGDRWHAASPWLIGGTADESVVVNGQHGHGFMLRVKTGHLVAGLWANFSDLIGHLPAAVSRKGAVGW